MSEKQSDVGWEKVVEDVWALGCGPWQIAPPSSTTTAEFSNNLCSPGNARDLLRAIAAELRKRADWHSNQREDPHGIANAVMVALLEVYGSIYQELDK